MYNRPVSAFANGLHDSMPMLVIRKCDQAKGFGVRVDLAVTSDGKSIIVCNQTTICDDFCCIVIEGTNISDMDVSSGIA